MGRAFRRGLMAHAIKVVGSTIKRMEEALFGMCTATNTKENGKMTRPMDMEFTRMLTAQNTRETGPTISNTGGVSSSGQMVVNTKEFIKLAASTDKAVTCGLTGPNTQETGSKIKFMAAEDMSG